MIITCTSCSARYQLADAKIKASGTKVRCPKCSNKFIVFPDSPEGGGERTELLGRNSTPRIETAAAPKPAATTRLQERPASIEQAPAKTKTSAKPRPEPKPEPRAEAQRESINFDEPTRGPAEQMRTAPRPVASASEDEMTPVFERDIPEPKIRSYEPPVENFAPQAPTAVPAEREVSEPSASEQTPSQVRPFGAQTLFEIQRADRRRNIPKWAKVAAIVGVILGGSYLSLPMIQKMLSSSGSSSSKITIERPSGWYRDDPGVYQEEMVRQAGLPMAEKELPGNIAILAEALVLNGLLSNAQDQVNQGLLFAQRLQLEHGNSVAPLYSMAANAIAADQLMVMKAIFDRWPEEFRTDPEYRLLDFMTLIKVGRIEEGLQSAKALLSDIPEFQRANDYALLSVLQNGPEAASVVDRKFREQLMNRYDSQHNLLERSMSTLPPLYVEIDRLLGRKPKVAEAPTPKQENSRPEPAPQKTEELKPIPRNVESVASLPSDEKPSILPKEKKAQAKKPNSKRLPPPSDELVETTKLDTQEKRDARKFYNQGNDLYKRGDVDGALAAYRQALKLDPEFADVYKRLGILYMEQKRNDRAVRSFKIYLQLRPSSSDKKEVEAWISSLQ